MRKRTPPLLLLLPFLVIHSSPVRAEVAAGSLGGESGYWLRNGQLEAFVTAESRLRLLCLRRPGGDNLLARQGETIDGLRPWLMAPVDQAPGRDDIAATSGEIAVLDEHTIQLTSAISPIFSLQLEWVIRMDPQQPRLALEYRLANRGEATRSIGIWPLFGLGTGARILLPLQAAGDRPENPRPLFHYAFSKTIDPRFDLTADYLQLHVRRGGEDASIKLGVIHDAGIGGAIVGDTVLVSQVPYESDLPHPEGGPNLSVYASPASGRQPFGELEHMGPLHQLDPGEVVLLRQSVHLEPLADSAFLRGIGFQPDPVD
jgi:hypothetical protein